MCRFDRRIGVCQRAVAEAAPDMVVRGLAQHLIVDPGRGVVLQIALATIA